MMNVETYVAWLNEIDRAHITSIQILYLMYSTSHRNNLAHKYHVAR